MQDSIRGSGKFLLRGSNFDYVFLVDDGREDPNATISGPSSARQRNAIFAGVPMMLNGVSLACR